MRNRLLKRSVTAIGCAVALAAAGQADADQFSWRATNHDLGAAHALELPFVFDNLDSAVVPMLIGTLLPPQDLADTMHRAWVEFAHGRSPGRTRPVALTD